jgi:putative flavoprotein involved in K+ transport
LPQRLLGRDLFWWLTKTGLIEKTTESRIGRRARHRDTLIGSSPRDVKRRGVTVHARVVGASDHGVTFADGSRLDVDAVVLATGYRSEYGWIDLPVFDDEGRVVHRRGVTDCPGLFFLGLTQHTRGSALLGWVKDGRFIMAVAANADDLGQARGEAETAGTLEERHERPAEQSSTATSHNGGLRDVPTSSARRWRCADFASGRSSSESAAPCMLLTAARSGPTSSPEVRP